MPYILSQERVNLPANPGSLNYLITRVILKSFIENPRYDTIHVLKLDFVIDPKNNPMIKQLRSDYADYFTVADIHTAAAAAYSEFERRVVAKYEDKKIQMNGDLPEYEEALRTIEELDKPVTPEEVKA